MKTVVETFSLCSTFGQYEDGTFPRVTAKNVLGKQLTDFSCSRFDCSGVGDDPITLCE